MTYLETIVANRMMNQIGQLANQIAKDQQRKQYLTQMAGAFNKLVSESYNGKLMTYWMKVADKPAWVDSIEQAIDSWEDGKSLSIYEMVSRYTGIEVRDPKLKFRLFNHDLNDVHDYYETVEEATADKIANYFFMTDIQELVNGKWVLLDTGRN